MINDEKITLTLISNIDKVDANFFIVILGATVTDK